MSTQPRVTVWHEYRHEHMNPKVAAVYPEGMHTVIAAGLKEYGLQDVRTATLDEPQHGLSDEVLENTDVLFWWGHKAHDEVKDEIADKVVQRVLEGMGFVALHSGQFSKPFTRLMGTTCSVKWREANDKERLWVVNPSHPIAQGVGEYIELEREEMFGENFDIPTPDDLVFISWFSGGEVLRSGCTFRRGHGKIFYFRPGHETYPTYYHQGIQRVLANAARWAMPTLNAPRRFGKHDSMETVYPDSSNTQ